jgi:hypothetical protein
VGSTPPATFRANVRLSVVIRRKIGILQKIIYDFAVNIPSVSYLI